MAMSPSFDDRLQSILDGLIVLLYLHPSLSTSMVPSKMMRLRNLYVAIPFLILCSSHV